jgi:hypothetical protein
MEIRSNDISRGKTEFDVENMYLQLANNRLVLSLLRLVPERFILSIFNQNNR